MLNSISLILPLYNEIEYIRLTIKESISVLESIGLDYEIVIVDDASHDGSEKIADELARSNSKIKVIHHIKNRKLGLVLINGFSYAAKDIVVYTDMDMPFDMRILKNLVPLIGEVDIINGYKDIDTRARKRILYSKIYNFFIRIIFGVRIKDFNCAMKIFKKEILKNLALKSKGSFINAEFLIKAKYLNYKILEVPVKYMSRRYGKSRLASSQVILKIIYEMIKLYFHILLFRTKH